MTSYPRYITRDFKHYDPMELARMTECIVCKGNKRKYTKFYCVGVYGGISTGYTVGCNLRCAFCWVDWSRDFPEKMGEYFSPQQVFDRLVKNAKRSKVSRLRISGGEPTLCKTHLLELLDLIDMTDYHFILETNGILFGTDKYHVHSLRKYRNVHIRLCIKAGTKESFEQRTGSNGEFWELPYQGIKHLMEAGVSFHVACMSDPRLMPKEERQSMLRSLRKIGYDNYLEEEICDPYKTSVARMEHAGFDIFEK